MIKTFFRRFFHVTISLVLALSAAQWSYLHINEKNYEQFLKEEKKEDCFKHFPLEKAYIEKLIKRCNITDKINIIVVDNDIGFSSIPKTILIPAYALIDIERYEGFILHEIGHIYNSDWRASQKRSKIGGGIVSALMLLPFIPLHIKIVLFMTASFLEYLDDVRRERRADKFLNCHSSLQGIVYTKDHFESLQKSTDIQIMLDAIKYNGTVNDYIKETILNNKVNHQTYEEILFHLNPGSEIYNSSMKGIHKELLEASVHIYYRREIRTVRSNYQHIHLLQSIFLDRFLGNLDTHQHPSHKDRLNMIEQELKYRNYSL